MSDEVVKPHEEVPIAQCNGVLASDLPQTIQATKEPDTTVEKYTIEEDSEEGFHSVGESGDDDKDDYGESKKRSLKRLPQKADSNRNKLKTTPKTIPPT